MGWGNLDIVPGTIYQLLTGFRLLGDDEKCQHREEQCGKPKQRQDVQLEP